MRILPVLDIQDKVVVRGVAGRRSEYRPIVSRLTTSCQPVDVAQALRAHFGLTEFYVADLDAIGGADPAFEIYETLRDLGLRLWVDAGVRTLEQAQPLADIAVVVVGLETVASPEALARICRELGGERVAFSLDLKEGQPLGARERWRGADAWSIAEQALGCGVQRLIVLDLARVGVGGGTGTDALCARIASSYPQLELVAGGGVRDLGDLQRLQEGGVHAVLVASALHDGRLSPELIPRSFASHS